MIYNIYYYISPTGSNDLYISKLRRETAAEILRLEGQIANLRFFQLALEGKVPGRKKPVSRRKSAKKKNKTKLTKNGKKIGRPTNAEKLELKYMLIKEIK
jgi:hypothetical protein